MDTILVLAIATIIVALLFEYTNGFHDAANIIATVIASRAMTPVQAVLVVAFFEFLGPLLGGTAVANTIGKFVTLDDLDRVTALAIVFCGLLGAIAWNLLTWWRGIPSSSSHALVGGLAGVVMVAAGANHVSWGFARPPDRRCQGAGRSDPVAADRLLGRLRAAQNHDGAAARRAPVDQPGLALPAFATSAGLAFSHGANDAQKSMGILTLVLGGVIPTFEILTTSTCSSAARSTAA